MAKRNPVSELIELFDGLRPMLRALGEKSPNLIQTWEAARSIPHWREHQVRAAVKAKRLKVPAELLAELFPEREAA